MIQAKQKWLPMLYVIIMSILGFTLSVRPEIDRALSYNSLTIIICIVVVVIHIFKQRICVIDLTML